MNRLSPFLSRFALFLLGAFLIFSPLHPPAQSAVNIDIIFEAGKYLSWTAASASFQLSTTDFISGSTTNTLTTSYTVTGTGVTRTTGFLRGRLGAAYTGINLQVQFNSYTVNAGSNARLIAAAAGFITLTTVNQNLATKQRISGAGRTVNGTLFLDWRATLTTDQPSGTQTQTVTLTVADV